MLSELGCCSIICKNLYKFFCCCYNSNIKFCCYNNYNTKKNITKCNKIISKFYSIENLIYNQIIIENLLKDYQWNDRKLKNIDNNELIINLKNSIQS